MTDEEVKKVEGDDAKLMADGSKPTDPKVKTTDLPHECGRGFSGAGCGYNSAWIDPGSTVMRVNGEPRSSFITDPPDGHFPPTKPGVVVPNMYVRAHYGENPENQTLGERCLTSFGYSAGPVMLPLLYNNNYEIAQSKDMVAIVVETTNFPEATSLHGAWKELKVTERFTRVGPHRVLYQFTVMDPTV